MPKRVAAVCILCLFASVLLSAPAGAAGSTAPLEDPNTIGWVHAPYEVGDCSLCHEQATGPDPGAVTMDVNELCFGCHDQIAELVTTSRTVHAAVEDECTLCHNPHNGPARMLLLDESPGLCVECHDDVGSTATDSPVKHDAVTEGSACLNCHTPHASEVQSLLSALPYDQCVDCHGTDDLLDGEGKLLTNVRALIDAEPVLHGPVDSKDCSACHVVHGGEYFRLLTHEYPARFYAGYDAADYALCFECHESERFVEETTTTLTDFRDGSRNLHYIHVNKERRGRTCRACHDVHAAPQEHLIRDGVPYGSHGWILKINFERTPDGGTCAKTCHPALSYGRTTPVAGTR